MIFLLDTDITIFVVRGLKTKRKSKHHIEMHDRAVHIVKHCKVVQSKGDSVGLSAITVSELEYGARRSGNYSSEIAAVRKILTPFDLYDYDAVVGSEHYGRNRQEVEAAGVAINALDVFIAAHAFALNATLVTNNERHFRRISNLRVENWASDRSS